MGLLLVPALAACASPASEERRPAPQPTRPAASPARDDARTAESGAQSEHLSRIREAAAKLDTSGGYKAQEQAIKDALDAVAAVRPDFERSPDRLAELDGLRSEIVGKRLDILVRELRSQAAPTSKGTLSFQFLRLLGDDCADSRREEVAQVRGEFFEGALRHARARLGDRPDFKYVASVLGALTEHYPERASEIEALRQEALGRVVAKLEQLRQIPRERYFEALPKVESLLAIDPENRQAQELRRQFQEAQAELQPTTMSGLVARREGTGLLVQFTLKNRAGQTVASPGTATVTMSLTNQGHDVGMGLYRGPAELTVEAFRVARGSKYAELPVIPYANIEDPISGQGFGSVAFKAQLRENGLGVKVSVQFTPASAEPGLVVEGEFPGHSF